MKIKLFIILILLYNTANSQAAGGFEEYYYVGNPAASALVSRAYYQNNRKWYGEVRYNYEEVQTVSLYAGKTFSRQDSLSWSVTPVAGLVMGKLKGGSVGMNVALDYRNLSFTSAAQYTFSNENQCYNFFFTWSELGYQVNSWIYAGLAMQQTRLYRESTKWEPGIQMDITFKKWTFPIYAFNPVSGKRYFVLGVTREWKRR